MIFENSLGTGNVTLERNGPPAQPGTYGVELLWFNGTSFQNVAVYQPSTSNGDGPGYFNGVTVTVPVFSAVGTFEVAGWTGNYANLNAALAGGGSSKIGITPTFANGEGEPSQSIPPVA